MYVRLAFAVAAHLAPDILIVDEVLAVGDSAFQAKCLGRMSEATAREGRTVIFVSHNMAAVGRLCSRAILLEAGRIVEDGATAGVIQRYLGDVGSAAMAWKRPEPYPSHTHLREMTLGGDSGGGVVTTESLFDLRLVASVEAPDPHLRLAVLLHDSMGAPLFSTSPIDDGAPFPTTAGRHEYRVRSLAPLYMPQRYSVTASLYSRQAAIDVVWHALSFRVEEVASLPNLAGETRMGALQQQCHWSHIQGAVMDVPST